MAAPPIRTHRALTVSDVVDVYNTSKATIYRLVKNGTLTFFKIGNQLRFWPEDVEAALLNQPLKPPTPAQQRAKLLGPDTIAFLSELAAAAPALTEEQKDQIRAAFRGGPHAP